MRTGGNAAHDIIQNFMNPVELLAIASSRQLDDVCCRAIQKCRIQRVVVIIFASKPARLERRQKLPVNWTVGRRR